MKLKTRPKNWTAIENEVPKTNFSKKKHMQSHPAHSLSSKKDVFNWDDNILNEIKNEMNQVGEKKIVKKKNDSHIFDQPNEEDKTFRKKKIENTKVYESNIFKKPSKNEEAKTQKEKGKKVFDLRNNSTEIKSGTIFAGHNKGRYDKDIRGKKPTYKNYCSNDNPLGLNKESEIKPKQPLKTTILLDYDNRNKGSNFKIAKEKDNKVAVNFKTFKEKNNNSTNKL
ncbi:MAG: hypothetical protein ACK5YA_00970 [bacterium]